MAPSSSSINFVPLHKLKVWVLAPYLKTNDTNIDYFYDFSQSIEEYRKVFEDDLHVNWKWQPVTMNDYEEVIAQIVAEKDAKKYVPLVLNLCDGDEVNNTPGISVLRLLEESGLIYSGADEYYYNITTSKISMKKVFDKDGVATPLWKAIRSRKRDTDSFFDELGSPIIVKPAVSAGGSIGVGIKNVVNDKKELKEQVQLMFDGYRDWELTVDGIVTEQFINGPEYTSLVVGPYDNPDLASVYTPVERVFHASLPEKEKFLSFDRLWEIYEDEAPMPNDENFYTYQLPDASLIDAIKKISWDAYCAVKGRGYGRIDIRQDKETGKLYVLEVNAQCGLSDDEAFTSIGAILRLSGKSFTQLVTEILNDAFDRKNSVSGTKRKSKKKIAV